MLNKSEDHPAKNTPLRLNLKFDLTSDGILIIRPEGPLRSHDFEELSEVVDPFIETHKKLLGVVICVEKFPGWENFNGFIKHIQFVDQHHKEVQKVALAVNGILPDLFSHIAAHFISAEIKQFGFNKLNEATRWIRE